MSNYCYNVSREQLKKKDYSRVKRIKSGKAEVKPIDNYILDIIAEKLRKDGK